MFPDPPTHRSAHCHHHHQPSPGGLSAPPPHPLPPLQRKEDPITLFMGVPTMYAFLLSKYKEMPEQEQRAARAAAARLRLAVSGSSACPLPIMSAWQQLSGGGAGAAEGSRGGDGQHAACLPAAVRLGRRDRDRKHDVEASRRSPAHLEAAAR